MQGFWLIRNVINLKIQDLEVYIGSNCAPLLSKCSRITATGDHKQNPFGGDIVTQDPAYNRFG